MPHSNNQMKKFLDLISQLESSGGKNIEHEKITSGLQTGQQAMGRYGLLPNTTREFLHRRELNEQPLPQELRNYSNITDEQLKEIILSNPNLEEEMAQDVARHLLYKQMGDDERAAYAWQFGHNRRPEDISPETLEKSRRIAEYRRLKESMRTPEEKILPENPNKPTMQELDEEINKAFKQSFKKE